MLKLGSDQRRKWLYLCGSHRIYWHLWEFSSVSNQIFTLRWIQTKNSKNISWSFPSWHRPPVRLSSSGHFTYLFFFAYFSRVIRWSEHFQQSFPKKNKTNIYSFYIKSAQKTKKKIKHLHCQQEFEHNAVILTLHRDVNQFREFRWRSRLVNRLTVTNTKTGGCSDYQLHCKKQSHHSSLEFWGGVSPGKHAYTEWEPPPPTASNHTLLLLRSVCKNKKGSKSRRSNWGGAAAEAQNTERRLGRISEVDICSFSPLQVASGERRHHRMSTWTNQVAPFLIKMVKPIS